MTLRIGVDYMPGVWKICVVDQDRPADFSTFAATSELLSQMREICALYPEPTIVLSLPLSIPFCSLRDLSDERLDHLVRQAPALSVQNEIKDALRALRTLSGRSYCAPSVVYLPTVPLARRLLRPALGSAREVCAALALLQPMRVQAAPWSELSFLFVHADVDGTSVLILQAGQIVNGLGVLQGSSRSDALTYLAVLQPFQEAEIGAIFQQVCDEAFWEGLTQELAGLMAIHHIEDLVVLGRESGNISQRLAEIYQVYLFPHQQAQHEGYEAALGAALLAEGLDQDSSVAELVEHLQLLQAVGVKQTSES